MLNSVLFAVYAAVGVAGLMLLRWSLPRLRVEWAGDGIQPSTLVSAVGGAALYVLSFGVWMVILARLPFAVAYPVAVGLTLVLGAVVARLLLGESLTYVHVAGMAAICAGIILLSRAPG